MSSNGIGIHITETNLRIIKTQVTETSTSVTEAFEFELPFSENEKFAPETAIKFYEFLQQNSIKISSAVVGVSGEDVNIRYVKAPASCPEGRLYQIAQMEMEQISDNANVSLSYDYMLLDLQQKVKDQTLLMVLIRNSFIDRITEFLEKAKIKVEFFVPSSLGLYHFYLKCCALAEETCYLADVGKYDINLAIVNSGALLFLRNLNIREQESKGSSNDDNYDLVELDLSVNQAGGEETISAPSPIIQKNISDLLEASTKFAKLQTNISSLQIDKILLTGEESNDRKLRESLLKKMGCPVVHLQVQSVTTKDLSPKKITFFQQCSKNFHIAIGLSSLAALKENSPIQIISARKKALDKLFKEKLFEYAAIAIALFAVIFSMLFTFTAKSHYEELYNSMSIRADGYSSRDQSIKEIVKENTSLNKKSFYLQNYIYSNKYFLEIFAFINANVPETMYLNELDFVGDGERPIIKIKGTVDESFSDVYSTLDEFRKKMKESPFILEIKDRDPKLDEEEGRLNFTLEILLKKIEEK